MLSADAHRGFYQQQLGFTLDGDYGDYLIFKRDAIELHFFAFAELDVKENYGQVYIRVDSGIEALFEECKASKVPFTGAHKVVKQPWGMMEFAIIDPAGNCLTFGQGA